MICIVDGCMCVHVCSSVLWGRQNMLVYKCILFCWFMSPTQFVEAYRNLQNTSRRHLNVHEPLIYDAVWLTAEVLNTSLPILSESNLTLDTSQQKPTFISILKRVLENNSYSGLTVRCYKAAFYDAVTMNSITCCLFTQHPKPCIHLYLDNC